MGKLKPCLPFLKYLPFKLIRAGAERSHVPCSFWNVTWKTPCNREIFVISIDFQLSWFICSLSEHLMLVCSKLYVEFALIRCLCNRHQVIYRLIFSVKIQVFFVSKVSFEEVHHILSLLKKKKKVVKGTRKRSREQSSKSVPSLQQQGGIVHSCEWGPLYPSLSHQVPFSYDLGSVSEAN